MFDGEHGIVLHTMQGSRASSHGEREVSWFYSVAVITWGIFSSFLGDEPSKLVFVQLRQDSCLVTRDARGIYSRLGRAIWTLLVVRQETKFLFLVSTVILVFLSIFNTSQASSSFEALNSTCLSRVKGI